MSASAKVLFNQLQKAVGRPLSTVETKMLGDIIVNVLNLFAQFKEGTYKGLQCRYGDGTNNIDPKFLVSVNACATYVKAWIDAFKNLAQIMPFVFIGDTAGMKKIFKSYRVDKEDDEKHFIALRISVQDPANFVIVSGLAGDEDITQDKLDISQNQDFVKTLYIFFTRLGLGHKEFPIEFLESGDEQDLVDLDPDEIIVADAVLVPCQSTSVGVRMKRFTRVSQVLVSEKKIQDSLTVPLPPDDDDMEELLSAFTTQMSVHQPAIEVLDDLAREFESLFK